MGSKEGTILRKSLGSRQGSSIDPAEGHKPGTKEGARTQTLEHKKQLWKSLKHRFLWSLTSSDDSIDTSFATSVSSDLDSDGASLVDPSPIEVLQKPLLAWQIWSDPTESMPVTSNDSESNKTVHVANESHQDITPPPLVVLDSPDNIDEPRAMIDKGAKATATNLLHLLHKPVFFAEQNSSPVKMHGATAKDMLISPIAKGFLQIPAMTLPGWMEVECCHSPCFTATLLSEQDLLNATCQKYQSEWQDDEIIQKVCLLTSYIQSW